jgi:hypothetical protein
MRTRGYLIALLSVLFAEACGSSSGPTPTSPTRPSSASSTASNPSPLRESTTFEMSGAITNNEGTPVANATVTVWHDDFDVDRGSAVTDGSGRYQLTFTGVRGSEYYPNLDPPGTQDGVGFIVVEAAGYERYARYILGTSPQLIENVHLHPIRRITAGDSAMMTIVPDDTACVLDAWPGRELICGIVRVVPPREGVMKVEAVSSQPGSQRPVLALYGGGTGAARANPTSLPVVAGIEYFVDIELPWGTNQSVVLQTSITSVH